MHTVRKRLLAILLTLAMVVSLFPVTALADAGEEGGSIAPVAEEAPAEDLSPAEEARGSIIPAMGDILDQSPVGTITIGNATVCAGQEFAVDLILDKNPGLCVLQIVLDYDSSALAFWGVEEDILTGWTVDVQKNGLLWDSDRDHTDTGTLLKLKFRALEDAAPGEFAIAVTRSIAANNKEEYVAFDTTPGTVTILSDFPGDEPVGPIVASGTCGAQGDNLTWSYADGALVISGAGDMADYSDPSEVPWKDHRESITSISLPEGLESIGSRAFYGCSGLSGVTIPAKVASIGQEAFSACTALSEVYLECNSLEIEENAFTGVTATIHRTMTGFIWKRNYGGELTWNYYGACGDNLTYTMDENGALVISGTGDMWDFDSSPWIFGPLGYEDCEFPFLTSVTISDGVTSIGDCAFSYYDLDYFRSKDKLTSVTIPESVTRIGAAAFHGCSALTAVAIPEGVTSIETGLCEGCSSLKELSLPSSLVIIEHCAFIDCSSLVELNIPENVTTIGSAAFESCSSLVKVTLPEGLSCIDSGLFYGCTSLKSVNVPDSVTYIDGGAFVNCSSLTSLTIPSSVETFWSGSLTGCTSLSEIRFLGSVPELDGELFQGITATVYYPGMDASWTEEVRQSMGGNITWVPEYAVVASGTCGDNLTWTLDENGLLSISGTGAMWNFDYNGSPWCDRQSDIKSVFIPSGVTSIGDCAFQSCDSIQTVNIDDLDWWLALSEPNGDTLPHGDLILNGELVTEITIPEGTLSLRKCLFRNMRSLQKVYLPESLREIEDFAFSSNTRGYSLSSATGRTIFFLGDAPSIAGYAFVSYNGNNARSTDVNAVALFPLDNASWTEQVRADYGAESLTWVGYRDVPALYTVRYDANGGENAPAEQLKGHGVELRLSSSTPTREKHRFLGWAADPSATRAEYAPDAVYNGNTDLTLYAVWGPDHCTVCFDANGGVGAPGALTKAYGQPLTLPNAEPSRADDAAPSFTVTLDPAGGTVEATSLEALRTRHYSFQSWNTAADGSGMSYAPGGSYTAEEDATLYAQWSVSTTTAPVSLPTPVRSHYIFKGWATSSTASGSITGSYTPYRNVTLYAVWEPERYNVCFDANGGEGAPEAVTKTYSQPLTLPNAEPSRADDAAPSFTVTLDPAGGTVEATSLEALRTRHYSFQSWNTAADGSGMSYVPGGSYTAEEDATLYAQWSVSTTTAPVELPTPVRSHYAFRGWATSSSASDGIIGSYTPGGDVTLYAVWERIPDGVLSLADAGGRPGTEIIIPVELSANPGISYLRMRVVYDHSMLECLGAADGSLTGWKFNANSGILQWLSGDSSEPTASGTILFLRFLIRDSAEDGDTTVSLNVLEAYNLATEDVVFENGSGHVAINSRFPGDVNGDAKVDILDLVRLLKYQAEEPVEIKASNADVNVDGTVNGKDLILLRRYLAGDPTVTLK